MLLFLSITSQLLLHSLQLIRLRSLKLGEPYCGFLYLLFYRMPLFIYFIIFSCHHFPAATCSVCSSALDPPIFITWIGRRCFAARPVMKSSEIFMEHLSPLRSVCSSLVENPGPELSSDLLSGSVWLLWLLWVQDLDWSWSGTSCTDSWWLQAQSEFGSFSSPNLCGSDRFLPDWFSCSCLSVWSRLALLWLVGVRRCSRKLVSTRRPVTEH